MALRLDDPAAQKPALPFAGRPAGAAGEPAAAVIPGAPWSGVAAMPAPRPMLGETLGIGMQSPFAALEEPPAPPPVVAPPPPIEPAPEPPKPPEPQVQASEPPRDPWARSEAPAPVPAPAPAPAPSRPPPAFERPAAAAVKGSFYSKFTRK
jgi:hypothetical protein